MINAQHKLPNSKCIFTKGIFCKYMDDDQHENGGETDDVNELDG